MSVLFQLENTKAHEPALPPAEKTSLAQNLLFTTGSIASDFSKWLQIRVMQKMLGSIFRGCKNVRSLTHFKRYNMEPLTHFDTLNGELLTFLSSILPRAF